MQINLGFFAKFSEQFIILMNMFSRCSFGIIFFLILVFKHVSINIVNVLANLSKTFGRFFLVDCPATTLY